MVHLKRATYRLVGIALAWFGLIGAAKVGAVEVKAGSTVTLAVSSDGTAPFTYQWKKNGVSVSGATSATLTLANLQAANAGNYSVVVSNSVGSITSQVSTLTIAVATAPVITTNPASQVVTEGGQATFSVAATGSPAPTYQWRRNGATISGATSASLVMTNVQTALAATYTVVVSNSAGTVTSAGATLTVNAVAAPATPTNVSPGSGAAQVANSATTPDFNGDNKADIVWQNAQTGERAIWLMNGTTFLSSSSLGIFPLEWTVSATGDFNRDGKNDIVWQNSKTGERAIWLMNGTNFLSNSSLGIFPLEWTVGATGDFNADGNTDIVWQNSKTGERAIWLMNGTTFLSSWSLGIFPREWTVCATGDFNGDGKADIVWDNNLTGERSIWLMNGTVFQSNSTLGIFPVAWTVTGTGDFNGDGKTDLLWQNSITGERAIWLMNGTNFLGLSTLGVFPLEWSPKS